MTKKQIFWGVLLISFGILLLLGNYTNTLDNMEHLWAFWPIVFILWGLSIIIKQEFGKKVLIGLTAIVLALSIFLSVYNVMNFLHIGDDVHISLDEFDSSDTVVYNFDYSDSLTIGKLNFEAGASSIILDKTEPEKSFQLTATNNNDEYDIEQKIGGNTFFVNVNLKNTRFHIHDKRLMLLKLNEKPDWDLIFKLGAAETDLDFSNFKIKTLSLETGASSTKIRLGDKVDTTNVSIKAGAASIDIEIPMDSGCEVITKSALSSKDFDGFNEEDNNIYRTENFKSATKKIYMVIETGLSSLDITRY